MTARPHVSALAQARSQLDLVAATRPLTALDWRDYYAVAMAHFGWRGDPQQLAEWRMRSAGAGPRG